MASGINIRMDPQLKEEFDAFCSDIGLTMTAAFVLFAKKCVSSHRIPFAIGDDLPMQGQAPSDERRKSPREGDSGERRGMVDIAKW